MENPTSTYFDKHIDSLAQIHNKEFLADEVEKKPYQPLILNQFERKKWYIFHCEYIVTSFALTGIKSDVM